MDSDNHQLQLISLFRILNNRFFNDILEEPIINIVSMEQHNATGSVTPYFFKNKATNKSIHLLKLNINQFNRSDEEMILSLLHEMMHLWQIDYGTISDSSSYHNKEYAARLEEVGLKAVNIVNGSRTGYNITTQIKRNGEYDNFIKSRYYNKYIKNNYFNITKDTTREIKKNNVNKKKTSYSCPTCSNKSWGKPGMEQVCGKCNIKMIEEAKI